MDSDQSLDGCGSLGAVVSGQRAVIVGTSMSLAKSRPSALPKVSGIGLWCSRL